LSWSMLGCSDPAISEADKGNWQSCSALCCSLPCMECSGFSDAISTVKKYRTLPKEKVHVLELLKNRIKRSKCLRWPGGRGFESNRLIVLTWLVDSARLDCW
jgi:hypothetical protein